MNSRVIKYGIEVSALFDNEVDSGNRSFKFENSNIIGFSVAKDFKNSLYPVVYMQISMSDKDYYYIVENKNHIRFLVKMNSYLVDDNGTLEDYLSNKRPYMRNTIMNMVFRPYFEDVTPYTDKKINEENILGDDNSNFKMLEVYLFSDESLEKNKVDCNFILKDASVFDALVYSCNKVGVKDLVIEIPDNKKVYEQIVSPPLKFRQTVNFLQQNYGIYNTGVIAFQDFERTYILPKYLKESVIEKDECKTIYILVNDKDGSNINMNLSSYYDVNKKIYAINTLNNLQFIDNSNFDKEIIGDSINVLNVDNINSTNVSLELNSYNNDITKNKNLVNYNNNEFLINEFKSTLQNRQISVSMDLVNIDISYITPNKEIVLIFEDDDIEKKYGGHYSIEEFSYSVVRESGGSQDFTVKASLKLNKVMYI